MDKQIKKGISFGLISGVITTLGMMIGLHSGTHSRIVVLGAILSIAVADAFSDALGVHVSEEAENQHTTKEIWQVTIFTFISKFIFALSFVLPVLFLPLSWAIIVSVIWGLLLIAIFSYYVGKNGDQKKPWPVVLEHLIIAIVVIFLTHLVGDFIGNL
jgi:VIT1/CCC1 family predicted Fe2+/Mn2+ transporter